MKVYKFTLLFLIIFVLCSCRKGVNTVKHEFNELNFSKIDTVSVQKIDSIQDIEYWTLLDGELICKIPSSEMIYTVFDNKTLSKKSVFGKKGRGKNEWISPHIVAKNTDGILVFDNGNKNLYSVKGHNVEKIKIIDIKDAINDVKTINYPIIGYVSVTPNIQCLNLINLEDYNLVDSISFIDSSNKGNSSLYDFVWNGYEDKIVIAHQHSDKFIIYKIDEKYTVIETSIYDTYENFSAERITYSDIACGKYIYILSQKNVNINDATGFSEVEIYDYNGNCIRKLVMNIIADKMLLDENNNRLFLTSIEDNSLNILNLK